ncbi:MAG TPA: DUF4159 domain-containing protein, partial [Terriglobia bacterium]|nr:DUF4159 domain-containing protein [Terriglobia bacterium]
KRAALIFCCAVAGLAAAFALLPEVLAIDPQDEPKEFYFTRLIYSGGGGRGRGGGRSSGSLDDENICQDADSMADHRQGGTWATDFPEADCKFMWGVERMTNARIHKEPHAVRIMDPELFDYPFVYAVEVGRGLNLNDEEAKRLREYLDRGGFWWCDDFWGLDEWDNFAYNMAKVFPEHAAALADPRKSPLELTPKHESFHTFFDIDSVMQIPNVRYGVEYTRTNGRAALWEQSSDTEPRIFGISDEHGRLQVLVTYNSDLGDAWEHMDNPEYPEAFSGQAYRMGMNFIIFGMTH